VLAIGMNAMVIFEARTVGLLLGQWLALVVATTLVAGLCVWIIGWEDDLERNPRNAEALSSLGAHLFEQEVYDESRELLLQAVKADRDRPADERKRTRMLLGIVHKYNHKYPESEAILKEGLTLQPAGDYDPKLMYVLARLYAGWGKFDDARAILKQILSTYSQSPVADKARETLVALDRKGN